MVIRNISVDLCSDYWHFGTVCLSVGRFVRSILVGLNYLHVYTASQLEQDVQKVKFKHNKFFKLFINYNE